MIDIFFLGALLIVLIQNVLPLLAAGGLAVCMARGFAGWLVQSRKFRRLEIAILLCVGYWLLNYELSTRSFDNLISYQFLRRDGALLVTYPAFFCLLHWRMSRRYFRAFWFSFLTLLSFIAGCAALVLGNFPYADRFEVLHIVGQKAEFMSSTLFYGWYLAHDTTGGVYTVACLVLLAHLVEIKGSRKFRVYLWAMMCCCLGGLALTYSRSGYVALMAGALVVLPIRQWRKTFKIGAALAIPLVLVLLWNSSVLDRIDTITDPNWGTNATRFILWRDAWYDFSVSPLIGIGFGRYNDLRRDFKGVPGLVYVATAGDIENNDSTAHNSYLHFLAEGGVLGLLVTMFVWWSAWSEVSYLERRLSRSFIRPFHRAAKGSLAAMLVYSNFDHSLGSGSNVLLLMSLVGLTLAISRVELAEIKRNIHQKMVIPSGGIPRVSTASRFRRTIR